MSSRRKSSSSRDSGSSGRSRQKKVYANGSTYIGGLNSKGRRHGEGSMMFKDGKYTGRWKNGKQHGHGVYVWNSGSQYEGTSGLLSSLHSRRSAYLPDIYPAR